MYCGFKDQKIIGIVFFALVVLGLILFLAFLPTFSLTTSNMNIIEGDYVTAHYEKEIDAAKDVFELADTESQRVARTLGFTEPQDVHMYIFDEQAVFQTKKYGNFVYLLGLFNDFSWYIGDNREANVLLRSD